MQLSSLKIIVTGGAQGMGAHFARRLAEAGAQVAAGDVKEDGLAELAESTRGLPGKVHARKLDVSSEADVGAFVEWAHGAMGGLNGLINNAGILRDGLLVKKDRTTGEIKKLTQGAVGRGHRRQPDRRDVHGARHRREDGRDRAAARRHRQHVVDRAPRQPRPVELHRRRRRRSRPTR